VGASFLILADIPGRMIEHGGETPIGVVTALVGAPMFIFVLRSRRVPA
jgi:iron complex transport system permease protein